MAESKRRAYKELSLSQLRSFIEVCQRGGYAAAARELLLTSPAVWEQMQALERQYGVRLLERRGGGVQPTIHGERLLELIRPVLAGLDSTRELLQQEDGAIPRQLTLITNMRVLVEEISQAMRSFQERYPTVRQRVLYTAIDEIEPLVLSGAADVALTLEPEPNRSAAPVTAYEPAAELDYLLSTPPRHALMRDRVLKLTRIVQYPLVLGETAAYSRHRVQEVLHRYDLTATASIAVETSSDEYTLSCVRAGLGVGITVGTGRGHLYRGLGVRSLRRWFGTARVGFLWKRGAQVPPIQRELAQVVRTCVTKSRQDS